MFLQPKHVIYIKYFAHISADKSTNALLKKETKTPTAVIYC